MNGTPDEPRAVHSKRLLIEVSHAIEEFALHSVPGPPTLVIALFQRLAYFDREAAVYGELAELGATTVVAVVGHRPPALPPGVHAVPLDESDPLAREWSLTVLSPTAGATLVTRDLETIGSAAPTLESGRLFEGGWSVLRDDAQAQAARLCAVLGERLPDEVRRTLDAVRAASPERRPDVDGSPERLANALVHHLTHRLAGSLDRVAALRAQVDEVSRADIERDRRSGLPTPAFLDRWLAGSVSGTVPVALLELRIDTLPGLRRTLGPRAEIAALRLVADTLRGVLRTRDRAVAMGGGDFLLVLPGRTADDLRDLHEELLGELARAPSRFPFVEMPVRAAGTVTRERPLPLPLLPPATEPLPRSGPPAGRVRG